MQTPSQKRLATLVRQNLRILRLHHPQAPETIATALRDLTRNYHFSISAGELLLLEHKWYVTHTALLRIARQARCAGIRVSPVREFCEPKTGRWAFEATVYRSNRCKGFTGHGDADPSNVSPLVRGAEMRVAETRAVNRALRKAYGIGLCSVEELGSFNSAAQATIESKKLSAQSANGSGYGGPKIRDRLCQIIRQHQLDASSVKSYATEFCGVQNLRDATREQIENFVVHLADWAEKDRNALLCQLNSYPKNAEGVA